jgi:hypothetical protein
MVVSSSVLSSLTTAFTVVIRFLFCAFLRRSNKALRLVFANDFTDGGEKVVVFSVVVVIISGRTCDEIFVYVSVSVYKCIKMSQILSRFFLLFSAQKVSHF